MSLSILDVGDVQSRFRGVGSALVSRGYDLISVESVARALERLRRDPPALVVLPLVAQNFDPIDFCRKSKRVQPTVPALCLADATDAIEWRLCAFEAGADACLSVSPHDGARLAAQVYALIGGPAGGVDVPVRVAAEESLGESELPEDALRRGNRMLRAIMDHVPEGVTISDATGRFVLSSKAGLELTGRRPHQNSVGEFFADSRVFRADGVTPMPVDELPLMRAVRRGEVVMGQELVLQRADGGRIPLLANAAPIHDEDGQITGGILVYRDISGRKAVEEALREADRRKDEFLAVLAHELRNPLASIRYALAVIEREQLRGGAERATASINRQVEQLSRLVDDLLDVGRIRSGKLELRRADLDLRSVVKAAVEAMSPIMQRAHHELTVALPDEALWLYADAARLRQVVTNLLHNAAKFTPRGGHVQVEIQRDGGRAVVSVRDDGIGFDPARAPKLFAIFCQGEAAGGRHGGLGIGLALARRLVEMHGGTIEASSEGIGCGAEFVIRLPLVPDSPLR